MEEGKRDLQIVADNGQIYTLGEEVYSKSTVLCNILKDLDLKEPIPLPDVSSDVFECCLSLLKAIEVLRADEFLSTKASLIPDMFLTLQFLQFTEATKVVTDFIAGLMKACNTSEEMNIRMNIHNTLPDAEKETIIQHFSWVLH